MFRTVLPYGQIDNSISIGVSSAASKMKGVMTDLADTISIGTRQLSKVNKLYKGRQLLYMIRIFLEANRSGDYLLGLNDLMSVVLKGDDVASLGTFLREWETTLDDMDPKVYPNDEQLHDLFYMRIKNVSILQFDMDYYSSL